jgi:mRNA interferase RelE/StbE
VAYELIIYPAARRELRKLPKSIQLRIVPVALALAEDPRPSGCEKLTGSDAWRVRVGEYRIVYGIDDNARIVSITRIAKRDEVYR